MFQQLSGSDYVLMSTILHSRESPDCDYILLKAKVLSKCKKRAFNDSMASLLPIVDVERNMSIMHRFPYWLYSK